MAWLGRGKGISREVVDPETGEVTEGRLTGMVQSPQRRGAPTVQSWVTRQHPIYRIYQGDEELWRASYVATRRVLAQFLVPHRHEGELQAPSRLRRAKLGHGVRLNASYVSELAGHIRAAPATYNWGPLDKAAKEGSTGAPSPGSMAAQLWADATRDGTSWSEFFEGEVLEWMVTSPGALVLTDNKEGVEGTQADQERAGMRPFVRLIPFSWLWDHGRSDGGWRWLKLIEAVDQRNPKDEEEKGYGRRYVLYELTEEVIDEEGEPIVGTGGRTTVSRWTDEGKLVPGSDQDLGEFEDAERRTVLPFVTATYGRHPLIDYMGSGLLLGLADVVVDLYNLMSEIREGFRDACFALYAYRGSEYTDILEAMKKGTRLVPTGPDPTAQLERIAADGAEVEAGLSLVRVTVRNWALGARRKAEEAQERSVQARSGVSLQAEFQLDAKPLLVEITEALDAVETQAMQLCAQVAGIPPEQIKEIGVKRETDFRLEDESDRIARKVKEFFVDADIGLPDELLVRLGMRWVEGLDMFDLDAKPEEGEGTLRDQLETEWRGLLEEAARAKSLLTQSLGAGSGPPFGEGGAEEGDED